MYEAYLAYHRNVYVALVCRHGVGGNTVWHSLSYAWMQLCMRKVDTKAVITVRMKLPILSAGIFWKSFIKLNFKLLNDIFLQGEPWLWYQKWPLMVIFTLMYSVKVGLPTWAVKPLPWRGQRGLGLRLKPLITLRRGWGGWEPPLG